MEPALRKYFIIADCGGSDFLGNTHQAKINGQIGIAYLLSHFGPPPEGSSLEVIEIRYTGEPFPCVALGFDEEPEGADNYANTSQVALEEFNAAVDWRRIEAARMTKEIQKIKEGRYEVKGTEHFFHSPNLLFPILTDIQP